MGAAAATRALTACCYLTDGATLVYVLELERFQAVIEDVRTLAITRILRTRLDNWRVVIPEGADA